MAEIKDTAKPATNVAKTDAEKQAEFKARKAEAAKRFSEKKKAEKKANIENAQKLIAALKKDGSYDKLPADLKTFVEGLASPVQNAGNGGMTGLFKVMFGDSPKVGDKITLLEVFNRTLKGKSAIDAKVKLWQEKGTIVEYVPAPKPMDSTYVLKAIGGAAE